MDSGRMLTYFFRAMLCFAAVLTLGRGLYFFSTTKQLQNHLVSSKAFVIKDIPPTAAGKVANPDPSVLYTYTVNGHEYQSWADISFEQYQAFKTNSSAAIYYKDSNPAISYVKGDEPSERKSSVQVLVGLGLSALALLALFKLKITDH